MTRRDDIYVPMRELPQSVIDDWLYGPFFFGFAGSYYRPKPPPQDQWELDRALISAWSWCERHRVYCNAARTIPERPCSRVTHRCEAAR